MQHITSTLLPGGLTRLTPEPGYLLLNTINRRTYAEAEVSDTRPYTAVPAPAAVEDDGQGDPDETGEE